MALSPILCGFALSLRNFTTVVAGPVSLAVILQTGFDTLIEQLLFCCSFFYILDRLCLCVLPVKFSVLNEKFSINFGVDVHNALAKRI